MCEKQFICGDDLTDNDLADYDNGILVPWRIAADGTQWYRHTEAAAAVERHEHPMIHGVAEEAGLDDFERALLQQWADELRQAAGDDDGDDGQCE
jgi:hypothetical protein